MTGSQIINTWKKNFELTFNDKQIFINFIWRLIDRFIQRLILKVLNNQGSIDQNLNTFYT